MRRSSARDRAGVGRQFAGEHAQQRALAAAVGAEQAELAARRQRQVEAGEQRPAAERLGDARRGEQLPRLPAGGDEVDARRPGGGVAVLQLLQLLAPAGGVLDARRCLARPRRGLAAEPLRLAADLVGDRLLPAGLALEELLALEHEVVVEAGAAEVAAGVDPADLDHLVGDGPQERPVVGGDEVAERRGAQQAFQPDDARQVEVVGRLVEQQQVGLADQLARQRQPLAPAAGEHVGRLVGVGEADLGQRDRRPRLALVLLDRLVGQRSQQHVRTVSPGANTSSWAT